MQKDLTLPIPQTHPGEIIGRDEDLEQLRKNLNARKRVVVVNGLGGIGKTTLVQAYVHKYYEDYDHIAWIRHGEPNDFVNTAGLLENLDLRSSGLPPRQLFDGIIRRLEELDSRRILLVIDHGEAALQDLRTLLAEKIHVIATARETIMGFYPQPLGFLKEEQALALFRKYYSAGTDQDIRQLIKAVDCHTLTIELLARTAAINQYEPSTLQEAIRPGEKIAPRILDRINAHLQIVLGLSRLTNQEIRLLKELSCLPSQFHPQLLLRELLDHHDPVMLTETFDGLVRKGWLVQNLASDSYKIHRVVAAVIRKDYPTSFTDVADLVEIINGLLRVDDNDDPADHFVWIPYGKALLNCFPDDAAPEIAMLQNHLALRLKDQGDNTTAKTLLEKAVQTHEALFGPDHLSTAISYFNLALVLEELGEKARARPLLENTLRIFGEVLPPDHPYLIQAKQHYLSINIQ